MQEVQLFEFKNNKVRVQYDSDVIWFCLKDVCNILDLSNTSRVADRLNPKGGYY